MVSSTLIVTSSNLLDMYNLLAFAFVDHNNSAIDEYH